MNFSNKNNEFSSYRITNLPPNNNTSYPVVNWGHGRILPYESTLSFSFKLCKLNGISPKQLNILMYGITGHDWYGFELNEAQFKKISRLLDENISIIRTLRASISRLPICYGTFSFGDSEKKISESSSILSNLCSIWIYLYVS